MFWDHLLTRISDSGPGGASITRGGPSVKQQLQPLLFMGALYWLTKAVHDPWSDVPLTNWAATYGLPNLRMAFQSSGTINGEWQGFASRVVSDCMATLDSPNKLMNIALSLLAFIVAFDAYSAIRSAVNGGLQQYLQKQGPPEVPAILSSKGWALGCVKFTALDASWTVVGFACAHVLNAMSLSQSASVGILGLDAVFCYSSLCVWLSCWLLLFEQLYIRIFQFIVQQLIQLAIQATFAAFQQTVDLVCRPMLSVVCCFTAALAGEVLGVVKYIYYQQPFYGSLAAIVMLNAATAVQVYWLQP